MWRAIRFLSMQGLRKMPEISGTGQPGRIFSQENFRHKQGKIEGLDKKVVAGHIGTSDIAGDASFHDIYYDGASHYYIDGTVLKSRRIPVLMVDTKTDRYYRVTESGSWPVQPYDMDDDE